MTALAQSRRSTFFGKQAEACRRVPSPQEPGQHESCLAGPSTLDCCASQRPTQGGR